MSKKVKDIMTDKEFDKLSYKESMNVINTHELIFDRDKNESKYIKKEIYYANKEDVIIDDKCDLSFLENAIINKVGFHNKAQEGGLSIVYTKDGEEKIVVLGFTELGMWIYANALLTKQTDNLIVEKSQRHLSWFDIKTGEIVGVIVLNNCPLKQLKKVFKVNKKDDLMLFSYKVETKEQEQLLNEFNPLDKPVRFDYEKYEYFIDLEVE